MSQIEVCNVDMPDAALYQFALSRLPPPSQPASSRPSLANLKTRLSQGKPLSLLGKDANAARLTASIADLEPFKRGLFGEAPIVGGGGGTAVTIKSPSAKEGGDGDHREIFPNTPPDAPPLFNWTNQMAANARLMRHLQTPKASFAASPLNQAAMDELDEQQLEKGLPTNAFNMAMEGEGEELMDEEEDEEAGHRRRPIRAKLHHRTTGDAGKNS
ncbi:unnamed protein product [Vitrella brassicaformis CCMP3155]|uniref:Uncharacterized protein n=1 Tax=Vitrella brassicaformis (strain CCMP3155) TaxID=1169540 RepID=A0A0G4EHX5_VITBC|nr:unnamed protein product [Vitrella brassicaformis CCMP3155]|eukprot:CEL95539.1 unnamed protein product [Vitrella brassicaformis CCMP3155]